MKMTKTLLAAALLAVSGYAAAGTLAVNVDSDANSFYGGAAKDTFLQLSAGEQFSVSTPTTDQWNNSYGNAGYWSDADGHSSQTLTVGAYTAYIGTLVGEIGNGPLFTVGTTFSGVANASGDLKFFYWDSDAFNNIGSVNAAVTAVPEPTNVALMLLGLGAFALTRRRKA